ncbi:MAG: hypothetical protein RSG59_06660 [Ruthenibacterium sp.]
MMWLWIIIMIIVALFALTFLVYITNADMKLVEKIYDALIAYHDKQDKVEKL